MEKNDGEIPFVKEHIVPSWRKKKKRFLQTLGQMCLCGAVFGICAALCFIIIWKCFNHTEILPQTTENNLGETTDEQSTFQKEQDTSVSSELPADELPVKDQSKKETSKNTDTNQAADAVQLKTEDLIQTLNQSIVAFYSQQQWSIAGQNYENSFINHTTAGFGIAIDKTQERLYFLTGNSSLPSGMDLIAEFYDGVFCSAHLEGRDKDADIAILSVNLFELPSAVRKKVQTIKLGDTEQLKTGAQIYLVGCPNGTLYSADMGIISGTPQKKSIVDYALDIYPTNIMRQEDGTSAVISPSGKLIGLMTEPNGSGKRQDFVSFSDISKLKRIIKKLIDGKPLLYCGIQAEDIPQTKRANMGVTGGIYVMEVEPNSPADKTGIRTGDIIQKVRGTEITSLTDFYIEISECEEKERVEISLLRSDGTKRVQKNFRVRLEKK